MFIVDAHLDLAYNALNHGRNLRHSVKEIRAAENGRSPNGVATVSIPDLIKAGVGVVFGTLFASPAGRANAPGEAVYHNAVGAYKLAMAQLDYYRRLADEDARVRIVGDRAELAAVEASYANNLREVDGRLIGIIPLMEGADPIRQPEEAEYWYERGLRFIGLAWDDTRYAGGAWHERYGLTDDGRRLLEVMAAYNFILDLTHMSDKAAYEALDCYEGPIVATHSNARALVPGKRQLNDTQIRLIGERDGVIGAVLYNKFLRPHHRKGDPRHLVTLDHVVAHIDHVCQLLGDAVHIGIGSDLDGGFGRGDIPAEMDSVADLPLIAARLSQRGYAETDIANIMGGNWLNLLRRAFNE